MKTCNLCHEAKEDAYMATCHGVIRNFCKACHAARQRARPKKPDTRQRVARVTARRLVRLMAQVPAINPAPLRWAA